MYEHSKNNVVIYLHVPKAAGNTLMGVAKRIYGLENVFGIYPNTPPYEGMSAADIAQVFAAKADDERASYKIISGHFSYGMHDALNLQAPTTYITVVRNPLDRLVSDYHFAKKKKSHRLNSAIHTEKWTLDDFIKYRYEEQSLTNGQTRMMSGYFGIEESSPFQPLPDEALDVVKQNVETHFAAVGTVERFDETLLYVAQALGWDNVYYRSINVVKRERKKPELNAETQEILEKMIGLDVQLYDFIDQKLTQYVQEGGEAFQHALETMQKRSADHSRMYNLSRKIYRNLIPDGLKPVIRRIRG